MNHDYDDLPSGKELRHQTQELIDALEKAPPVKPLPWWRPSPWLVYFLSVVLMLIGVVGLLDAIQKLTGQP